MKYSLSAFTIIFFFVAVFSPYTALAKEVDKGKIPAEHVNKSAKTLPWGTPIWDVADAIKAIDTKDQSVVWVDTRPGRFIPDGTITGAKNLVYDKTDSAYDAKEKVLTKESLLETLKTAGLSVDAAKIVFFCQGPKCHRSYNATHAAVKDWGLPKENIVWFRDGYPVLLDTVSEDAKLKRKAERYITVPVE